jgi:glycosyltransferase involved in cell wall biosynthesis
VTPLRVCIVGLKCYDLLTGAARPRYVGGAERQQVALARGLASRGHEVSLVTLEHGGGDGAVHHGVTVHSAYAAADGIPVVRFLHPRWSGLVKALRRSGADVFYQMGGDGETGQIALWCRMARKSFVFGLASDGDVDPALPLLRTRRQRVLYRAGLQRASAVVAQTDVQRARLRAAFGVDSTVIRNCSDDPGERPRMTDDRAGTARPRLLWVGRFVPVKRLELFLDLAASQPGWDCHVIGAANTADDYGRDLETRAASLPNVSVHRGISDASLDEQYRLADALVSTSIVEGVPTTFLEAWARGLPVISTVDPDGVIAARGLGIVTKPENIADSVRAVLQQDAAVLSTRIRAHYVATHTVDAYVSNFERLFASVTRTAVPQSAAGTT